MERLRSLALVGGVSFALCSVPTLASITYVGSRHIADATVNLTLTTDGTIGLISGENITDYRVTMTRGSEVISARKGDGGFEETFGLSLSATATDVRFDFSKPYTQYLYIGSGQGGFYCIQTSGCFEPQTPSEGAFFPSHTPGQIFDASVIPGTGVTVLATVGTPAPDPTPVPLAKIFNNSVHVSTDGGTISAIFSPHIVNLKEAAYRLGYDHFNWQQTVVAADPGVYPTILATAGRAPPFFDPIPNGYSYNEGLDAFPFYYDDNSSYSDEGYNLSGHISPDGRRLDFGDQPSIPCLGGSILREICYTYFTTALVGVHSDGSVGHSIFEFAWKTNFEGSLGGGVARLTNPSPTPNPGVGGATLISQRYLVSVPEPASWALMFGGLAFVGAAVRQRKVAPVRISAG